MTAALIWGLPLVLASAAGPPAVQAPHGRQPLSRAAPLLRIGGDGYRHQSRIIAFAVSPDQRLVASGGDGEGDVRVASFSTGRLLWTARESGDPVRALAFSPDGKFLACATFFGGITLWSVEGRKALHDFPAFALGRTPLIFSGDSRHLMTIDPNDAYLVVWDVKTGKRAGRHKLPARNLSGAALSPDRSTLAVVSTVGGRKGELLLLDSSTFVLLRKIPVIHPGNGPLAFSPDGKKIACGGADGFARAWGAGDGKPLAAVRAHARSVTGVAFSPDGSVLVSSGADGGVAWYSFARSAVTRREATPRVAGACGVALSPDGKWVLAGSATLHRWPLGPGKAWAPGLEGGHKGSVKAIAAHPRAPAFATASSDHTVRLWHVGSGEALGVLRGHGCGVLSVGFTPDGKRLVSAGEDGRVFVWRLGRRGEPEGGAAPLVLSAAPRERASSACLSPDGRLVALGTQGGKVRLWSLDKKAVRWAASAHDEAVTEVCFSPDGRHLATASYHGGMCVLSGETGRLVRRHGFEDQLPSLAFSADGKSLFCGRAEGVSVVRAGRWDVAAYHKVEGRYVLGPLCRLNGAAFANVNEGGVLLYREGDWGRAATLPRAGVAAFSVGYDARTDSLIVGGHTGVVLVYRRFSSFTW